MYNQQTFQQFAHNQGLMPDSNYQYNMNGYPGINHPHPQHSQTFYSFPTVKSDYGDLGVQAVGECSAQAMIWNHLPQLDPANQMVIHGQQQPREQMLSMDDGKRNGKRDRDQEGEMKVESPTALPPNPPISPYYTQTWGAAVAAYWPTAPDAAIASTSKTEESIKPQPTAPVQQYCASQSLNESTESGISGDNSRCSSSSSLVSSGSNNTTPRSVSSGPSEGICSDVEEETPTTSEMEQFAKELKHKRITMGYTQSDVGAALGVIFGKTFSQTTICRFESLQLSFKNMCKLKPLLRRWLHEVENNKNLEEMINRAQSSPQIQKRKHRTSIEASVKRSLENYYMHCPKPGTQEIARIAREIKMDKDVVRVWFCNRRQKGKRQVHPYLRENCGEAYNVNQPMPSTSGLYTMQQVMPLQGFNPAPLGSHPAPYVPAFQQAMPHGMPMGNHTG